MTKRSLISVVLVFSLLLVSSAFSCQGTTAWEQTSGPPGGRATWVAVDTENPAVVYAGMDQSGIYRSTDGGRTWEESSPRLGEWIGGIVSTPHGVFAACSRFAIYRTTDHGVSWSEITVAREARITGIHYGKLGDTLLASSEHGSLFASRDGGKTWREITGNLPRGFINAMAVAGPSEYWVGKQALYQTIDGGLHWEKASLPQPPETEISHILVADDDPLLVLVGLRNVHNEGRPDDQCYSWITRDGGQSWHPVWGGFDPDNGYWPLTQGPDGSIYVNNANNLYVSHDRARTWERLPFREGLNGRKPGDFGNMAVNPKDSNILYIPVLNGVARSRDGGMTWTVESEGMILTRISLLAASPTDPEVIYAASAGGEGTFRSTDRGDHWTWLNGGGLPHPWADELTIDPTNPDVVYETVDVADVYRSEDAGDSWELAWPDFRFSSIYALAAAPSDPDVLYACKNGFGIYKSEDGGHRWRFLHQSGIDYTYTIAVHPKDPDIVFSGYNPKPFQDFAMIRRSLDGGDTWETVLKVEGSDGITTIAFDPSNPSVLYAGSIGENGGRVYVSRDGGDTWNVLNERYTMCTVWGQPQLMIDPTDPSVAYAGTWLAGTWKTMDGGRSWTLLRGAPVSATSLSIDPLQPNVVYLSDRSSPTVWRSGDGGDTWTQVADFRNDGALLVMRVLVHDGVVFASTFHPGLQGGRLYRSSDDGATWKDVTGTLPKGILDIAVDPRNPQLVYVTTNINSAYKSADGGETWFHMDGFPDVGAYDIEIDPRDSNTLYASARGGSLPAWFTSISGDHPNGVQFSETAGVYKSSDGGETWTQVLETWPSCRVIRVHPENPNLLLAADLVDGLQVSIDGGRTWTARNEGLENIVPTSCAVGGTTVYVGTQGCGVFSGEIDLETGKIAWEPDRCNKPVPAVHSMEIQVDPTDSDILFVSANPGGLMRSTDGGGTWRDRNGITPSVVVDDPKRQGYYTFAIDPNDPDRMWVGTWGKGIYKSFDAMLLNIPAFGERMTMLGKEIYRIVIAPDDPDRVYVATEQGVFRTSDGGTTWEAMNDGLGTTQVRSLLLTADGRLVAGTLGYGLYEYDRWWDEWDQLPQLREFGTFWPIWNGRPLYQYSTLLIDPSDPKTMYFGTFPAGIYKTTDGGEHWRESNVGWTNDGVFCLAFHPEDTNVVYAGTYNGINRSLDAGGHWEMWDEGWPPEQWVFAIAFDPITPSIMYACSKNGENMGDGRPGFHGTVMKSIDGGAHWFPITDGLNVDQEFLKILVDPVNRNILYLATQGDGVMISRDFGEHWEPWNDGLGNLNAGTNGNNVANVLALSADGNTIYFATLGSGVWRRTIDR